MKINPVGIQTYQHLSRKERPVDQTAQEAQSTVAGATTIEPHAAIGSHLAVQGPRGSYADYLNESEREALELLFARFKNADGTAAGSESSVGRLIDVKV